MCQKILAVDDEPDTLRLTQYLLESWGYVVLLANNAEQAIELANRESPELILMDVNMDAMNGFQACEALKADFATTFIPIVMLTSQDQVHKKVTGLGKGADDYILKTVDPQELKARIQMVIRRTQEQSGANPLTRLPGNLAIDREINKRILGRENFSVFYCDLDNFKAFNDRFGYESGDRVIAHTAKLIVTAVRKYGSSSDFVGHIGGDDFVFVTAPDHDELLGKELVTGFDDTIADFYPGEHQGILAPNRAGTLESFPQMTISVAVVSGRPRDFASSHVLAERAAELKRQLKRLPGSNHLLERHPYASELHTEGRTC